MKENNKGVKYIIPKIYIAGKITGLVYEDALRAFAEAAAEIERCGHTAVNPMKENGLDGDGKPHEWVDYMERDIPLLLSCDGIYLLPNWKESTGARIEKVIAESSKMLIVTAGCKGRRGESFPVCKDCGNILDEDDREAGVYSCGECRRQLRKFTANHANERESEEEVVVTGEFHCLKCGVQLGDGDGTVQCYRCQNHISSASGVGIQSPARV